jgi:hypothetical protein
LLRHSTGALQLLPTGASAAGGLAQVPPSQTLPVVQSESLLHIPPIPLAVQLFW